ncbi:hypothetical protein MNBD_GAMMA18-1605 [hydrothermal vent metagenome]|uniref:Uncharacterized protein n=1 Tax=hydrothermal vent metagenome TaxID=652676 RepID=A0A3B0YUY1_9ZZZZ
MAIADKVFAKTLRQSRQHLTGFVLVDGLESGGRGINLGLGVVGQILGRQLPIQRQVSGGGSITHTKTGHKTGSPYLANKPGTKIDMRQPLLLVAD